MVSKKLHIPKLDIGAIKEISSQKTLLLSQGEGGSLTEQSWNEFYIDPKEVETSFSLAYFENTLFLLFRVKEPEIRATITKHNGNVSEDSCVELFIGDREGLYLNVECNPLGAVLAAIGTHRDDRVKLQDPFFSSLFVNTVVDYERGYWEALLHIPLDATPLIEKGEDIRENSFSANLYKCGDLLQKPHYLSWAPIATPKPDFHQSNFFAPVKFD